MTTTRTGDVQLFTIAVECDRLHEVWRKSCKAYSDAEGPMFDKRKRGEPISDAEKAKVSEAEALEDTDRKAYEAIETRLLCTQAHTPQGLATKLRIFRLYYGNISDLALFVDGFISDAARISSTELTAGGGDVPTFKTDWRKLLDEYTCLTIATNADDGPTLAADCAAHTAIECKIAEAPVDGLESLIAKLTIIWNTDRGWVGSDPRSIALSSVLDFLAGETGFDPFIEYDRQDELIQFSKAEIAEAAAQANETDQEGGTS